MTESNNREKNRDSLFLMAELVFADSEAPEKVRVRNLSAGGMMCDNFGKVQRGTEVLVFLRNVSQVRGKVVWVSDGRFGIAFESPINSKAVLEKPVTESPIPRYARPIRSVNEYKGVIRKI